jgi:aspartyl-tRNA(Asn)/glutamyl-tRNA(Gln) amidotransferase subunit A
MSYSLDHVGAMARRVADTAIALAVMDGSQCRDAEAHGVPHSRRPLASMRIGIPEEWFFDVCDPEVLTNFETAIEIVKARGATIRNLRLPLSGRHDLSALWWFTLAPELTSLHEEHLQPHAAENTNENFRIRIRQGHFVGATDYLRAQRVRRLIQDEYEAAFETVDVILTPGAACVAPKLARKLMAELGESREPLLDILGRVYHPFNLTGHPAVCIPSGLDRRGLPTSVQVVSALDRDDVCISVAEAIEDALELRINPPAYEAGRQ